MQELARRATIENFDSFFLANPPGENYLFGIHTKRLLKELHRTTKFIENGRCRYLVIAMPPRHGKSDIASRRYPAWHLIRNPNHEIILTSYNYSLASEMSYDCRSLLRDKIEMYGLQIQQDKQALSSWRISGHKGAIHAAGLGGTITGKGADVLIVDDYFKNREEAESETARQKKWESFQSDLLTRLAPVHAVVIVANRWHEDDIVGRIKERNDPESKDYDKDFPVFECIEFPAYDEKTKEWLFPERFSKVWYLTMKAFMGSYAWNAQALQEPKPRVGNFLRADLVQVITEDQIPKGLRFNRGWDIAATEKERIKDDPDYTVGTLAAYDRKTNSIYIKDVKRGQWGTLKRNEHIASTAVSDGSGVRVRIEVVALGTDVYQTIRSELMGKATVRKVTVTKDKVARASIFEPIFELGNVYIVEGEWNAAWKSEFLSFPRGKHDDQVDSMVVTLYDDVSGRGRMSVSR